MKENSFLFLTIISTIGFFIFFCGVIFFTFFKGKKKDFDRYAKIPMNDSDNITNHK
jgi:cbb3-type cytochrome oxidase subunit 3